MRLSSSVAALCVWSLLATNAFAPDAYAQSGGTDDEVAARAQEVLENPTDVATFERYAAALPRIGEFYVVENDILLTKQDLREYMFRNAPKPPAPGAQQQQPRVKNAQLNVDYNANGPNYWNEGERTLVYAIDENSFRTDDQYNKVTRDLAKATKDWAEICPECGLKFVHIKELDPLEPKHPPTFSKENEKLKPQMQLPPDLRTKYNLPENVKKLTFVVRRFGLEGKGFAMSFFPHARESAYLNIDPTFFRAPETKVGMLRHEVGHILGYRHEQLVGVPGCAPPDKPEPYASVLDRYDPLSVMHYTCGGGGTLKHTFSQDDIDAHVALYRDGKVLGKPKNVPKAAPPIRDAVAADERSLRNLETEAADAAVGLRVSPTEIESIPNPEDRLGPLLQRAPTAVNVGDARDPRFSFKGESADRNVLRIDGVDATPLASFPSDSLLPGEFSSIERQTVSNIRDFDVIVTNAPPQFGGDTGAYIAAESAKGGDALAGNIYYTIGNDALDARNFFTYFDKPKLRSHLFGAEVGGPFGAGRNYFFNYEELRETTAESKVELVPSASFLANSTDGRALAEAFFAPGVVILPGLSGDVRYDVALARFEQLHVDRFASARLDFALGKVSDKAKTSVLTLRFQRGQKRFDLADGVTGRRVAKYQFDPNGSISLTTPFTANLKNVFKIGYNETAVRADVVPAPAHALDLYATAIVIGKKPKETLLPEMPGVSIAVPGGLSTADPSTGRGLHATAYELSFVDDVTWSPVKGHEISFGGEMRHGEYGLNQLGGSIYTFKLPKRLRSDMKPSLTFVSDLSDVTPFTGGSPGERRLTRQYWIAYGQDKWQVKPAVTLTYGLRWEYTTIPREEHGRARLVDPATGEFLTVDTPFFDDAKSVFLPSVALAWTPDYVQETVEKPTTVRLGFDAKAGHSNLDALFGPVLADRVVASGGVPEFPSFPNLVVLPYLRHEFGRKLTPSTFARDFADATRTYQFSASIEQDLPGRFKAFTVTAAYVGKIGRGLQLKNRANLVVGLAPGATETAQADVVRQFDVLRRDRQGREKLRHPFGEFAYLTDDGRSHYHALSVGLQRRLTALVPVTLAATYTYSHSVSNVASKIGNPVDLAYDEGFDAQDRPHSVTVTTIWQQPERSFRQPNALANVFLSSWLITGMFTAQSGSPIDVVVNRPAIVYVDSFGAVFGMPAEGRTPVYNLPTASTGAAYRPDLVPGVSPYLDAGRQFLNPAAFALPATGTLGNLERGAIRGPRQMSVDLSLSRTFRFTEPALVYFEFSAQIKNIFNHANFMNPMAEFSPTLGTDDGQIQPGQPFSASTKGFGVLSSALPSRHVIFSLKMYFAAPPPQ
jgi:hypothetical protein